MLGWELPPHNSGGLGVACLHLTKYLADSGADIEFVLPYQEKHDIDFMKVSGTPNGDPKTILRAYDSSRADLFIADQEANYTKQVIGIIEDRSFDVIHAHDWLTFRTALRAKEQTGWPLIVHVHSVESDRSANANNPIVADIEQMTFLLADSIIAVSQHTKDKIIKEYDIPASKITVIHNSIDLEDLEPVDLSNTFHYLSFLKDQDYKVICNVSRQTVAKGLPNLLKAAHKVIKNQPKTIFLLVGDGEQQNELIEIAAELGISRNVIFAGFQRGKRLRDAFIIADLFVMPSISEPFGLAPLEAIGYGTPTLISKQSGVAEVLHHTLKVDFWDVDEMANQILATINSPALRTELLAGAQAEIETISWSQSADKFMKIYDQYSQVAA